MVASRLTTGDHLTADFNAQSYAGRLERLHRDRALTFNDRDATDTRSELGARFDRVLAVYSNAVLALRARLAWAHDDWVNDPTLVSCSRRFRARASSSTVRSR
jgi:hypothetical protein